MCNRGIMNQYLFTLQSVPFAVSSNQNVEFVFRHNMVLWGDGTPPSHYKQEEKTVNLFSRNPS